MRDLNRKVEKYLKEKSISSAKTKPSSALTPHVVYNVSSSPRNADPISNNLASRSFAMTVSFINPKLEKHSLKDYAIMHEDKKVQHLTVNSERARSPRRDPILQNNSEVTNDESRSTIKFTPLSGKTTLFSEEPQYSKKIQGEFNHVYNARSLSPKIEGIRTVLPARRTSSPEEERRQKKAVKSPHINKFNPITEGDITGVPTVKERIAPEISEVTKKLNDRNMVLPAERGSTTKGRVFWESSLPLSERAKEPEPNRAPLGARLGSPKIKPADSMKGVLSYDNAFAYRDQGVSGKCTDVPISVLKATEA